MTVRSILKMLGISMPARRSEIEQAYDEDLARSLEKREKILGNIMNTAVITEHSNNRLAKSLSEAKQTFQGVVEKHHPNIRDQVDAMLVRMKNKKEPRK
ncbi:MAG: hypothetical protein NVSMB28_21260 [Collimonas sp.]